MQIAVIGAGAAGLMTAAAILESSPDADVILIERNSGLGKKVIISGGGRCNVTTGVRDIRAVLASYPRGAKFLTKAMYAFPPEAVYAWFEAHGVPLKTEEDLRVFPRSDDGKDVVGAFTRLFRSSRIRIMTDASAVKVEKRDDSFLVHLNGSDAPVRADALVLTTGGQAYRQTGSTGDGYAFASSLGHAITPLAPSLNSFFTSETWTKEVSGLSFARATLRADRKKSHAATGPFLFTHRGVSGPAVFALSSLVAFETYDAAHPITLTIDLFPDETAAELRGRLERDIRENPRRTFVNALASLVPKSLVEILCAEAGLPGDERAADSNKKEMTAAVAWLKKIPLHAVGRGAGDEFVTAGGVSLAEVDPATMESRICPGLYFAGEILDVDGFTGGYNLQASWATGHLAGRSIATRITSANDG
jgi:hypothetical protein